ncbi:MAG: hypothetical protein LBO74_11865 [Candidatus Symbiothrix sp.]|jgi:hypothetical protein|nr:hypothetical protein [Candidatus Symbiothrix sp.]
MIEVNSVELKNNMKKYLDIETYILLRQDKFDTNIDLARAVTSEKLLEGIKADIREMYKVK